MGKERMQAAGLAGARRLRLPPIPRSLPQCMGLKAMSCCRRAKVKAAKKCQARRPPASQQVAHAGKKNRKQKMGKPAPRPARSQQRALTTPLPPSLRALLVFSPRPTRDLAAGFGGGIGGAHCDAP